MNLVLNIIKNILLAVLTISTLAACSETEIKLAETVGQIEFMEKSPYHLTLFQNVFGGDLIKLKDEFYTLVDAEGYINQGSKVKIISAGKEVRAVCQILPEELQEYSRCFSTKKI